MKLVSFNNEEARIILNLIDIACGSPNQKPGGLQVAMNAASISSKILSTFNSEGNQDAENKDSIGTD